MSEHTLGPWVVFDDHPDKACFHIREDNRFDEIATIYRYRGNPRDTLADARLIAAAPELLEALEYYVEKVADLSRYGVMIETSLREKAEAAIAKAKGE